MFVNENYKFYFYNENTTAWRSKQNKYRFLISGYKYRSDLRTEKKKHKTLIEVHLLRADQ